MDSVALLEFARQLIDIESTTGRERAAGEWLVDRLSSLGYHVSRQAVDAERFNVLAIIDSPAVVLSTHYDCVPPYFASRLEDGKLFGRGACDAKGILAAQVAAVERLRASGEHRVGLLFVVGEERGSDGAAVANRQPIGSRFLINGEPTDNRLASATRGVLRVRLQARGRAAHSAAPERGESAIDRLIDVLMRVRTLRWPAADALGQTFYNVGLIEGGVAPNVIPPNAEAEVFFRTVGEHEPVRDELHRALGGRLGIQEILELPAVRMHTVPGFDTAAFSYFSDVPFLSNWGTPLLIGPGSIHVAHTDREHLAIDELTRAVDVYATLATSLLAS